LIETPNENVVPSANGVSALDGTFRCEVAFVDEHAIVSVVGDLDLVQSPVLLRETLATLALPLVAVTLDLAKLTFLDSSGLSALITLWDRASERGIDITMISVPPLATRVIEVAGLADVFALPVPESEPADPAIG
jgi:anti-sigma B factor antagonist